LWSRLHNIEFTAHVCAFDVLRFIIVNLFDMMPNESNGLHEIVLKVIIQQQLLLIVVDSELRFLIHGVAVKETGACESWQILAV